MDYSRSIQNLIGFINWFLKNKTFSPSRKVTIDSTTFHYFTEIIRHWNKLNYIIKKIVRSLNLNNELNDFEHASLFYITYRIRHENATLDTLINDLKDIGMKERFYEYIESVFQRIKSFSWEISLKNKSEIEKISITESIPSFFIRKLIDVMDSEFIRENLRSMNNFKEKETFSAHLNQNVDFVLNTCFFKNFEFISAQREQLFQKDSDIPYLYNIPVNFKNEIINSELINSGDLVILDKASASVVNIFSPSPDDSLLDMCAAPGVKTSLISHYTKQNTHIFAIDFSVERTKEMKKFTARLNNNKIHILNSDSIVIPLRSSLKFDKILLDAPCTGSGALLSNPELKWRQNENFLHQNMVLQEKLLKSAIDLLKSSGILVYSTCSLYPEEGEYQIKKFLDKLEPMKMPNWMGESYQVEGSNIPGTARLFPAQHNTEGFFIAKFKKK